MILLTDGMDECSKASTN